MFRSIRSTLIVLVVALTVLALGVSAVLLGLGSAIKAETPLLADNSEDIYAIEEIEDALFIFDRERLLLAMTADPRHAAARDKAAQDLYRWLDVTKRHIDDETEQKLEDELGGKLKVLVARREIAGLDDPQFRDSYRQGEDETNDAYEVLVRFLDMNLGQNMDAITVAQHWGRVAHVIGYSLIAMLAAVRHRPDRAGCGAACTSRFGPWARPSRATARTTRCGHWRTAPEELRQIARGFNSMARNLEQQRQIQLGFLAAIAHDLRNPLSALKTVASLNVRMGNNLTPGTGVQTNGDGRAAKSTSWTA